MCKLKLLLICLTGCISLISFADTPAAPASSKELVFLNWSEYIDPELVSLFEQRHKVTVRQVYFETDDTRDSLLVETGGQGYDLVLSSGVALTAYRKQGWLAQITRQQVPNIQHIKHEWLEAFPDSAGYAVPYFWGTLGVAYRKDLLGYEITSWKQIFEPDEKLSGKILMANTVNDVVGMALKSLGYSLNSTNPDEYEQAEALLREQKKHVKAYRYMKLDEESTLATGEAYAAVTYSGDTLTVKEFEPRVEYTLPKEGGNLWVDYLVIMSTSKNKELAYQFINFLNEPEIAARLAEYVHCATPNNKAEKFLPKEFLSDPVIYPDKEALRHSEFYKTLPARIQRKRNNIFNNLTR